MQDFLSALGLVFALEGLVLAAFPAASRRAMEELGRAPESFLRRAGVVSAVVGVALVFVVRQLLA